MQKKKLTRIFQLIKNDKPQEDYFFKQLTLTTNPFSWLKPLKEKGYFDPQNNPAPQEVLDQPSYYTIPYWNVLGFLENVANKNIEEPDEEITNTLIDIINSIINYRDENGERIDNYQTDWSILKIIIAFSIERIEKQHIEFIRSALKSKRDNTLVASEIGKTVIPKLINDGAKNLLLELLDVILDYQKVDNETIFKYKSIMGEHWLSEALKEHKPKVAKLCSIEAADIALNKIKAIIKKDKSQFNIIVTIEDPPRNLSFDSYEHQVVHFVRDMFELSNQAE